MIILSIETSCDETAVALFEGDPATGLGQIRVEKIASQIETHAKFGGVVPEIASREHLAALPAMVDEVMASSELSWSDIDQIAVTAGPGLMGALLVGVSFARAAGLANGIPVMPIHHMEGHLLAPGLGSELPAFPFISLLVSGGHTLLIRVDGIGKYAIIGQTIDDAAGECFDKSARLIGLPYPGGPEISKLAQGGDAKRFKLPRPMLHKGNLNFSFSGLKTAVMYTIKNNDELDDVAKCDLAAGIETAIAEVLVKKTLKACKQEDISSLIIAGGVAANQKLRNLLEEESSKQNVNVYLPAPQYCTDNAAMIAYAAFQNICAGHQSPETWDAHPRWKLSEIIYPH
ncbi:MAG: tRNA (adenosine(37)-N6)-threonylcarbamoyltransferase complex transferase subunit TsaD [Mariprofundaceae bacterium]